MSLTYSEPTLFFVKNVTYDESGRLLHNTASSLRNPTAEFIFPQKWIIETIAYLSNKSMYDGRLHECRFSTQQPEEANKVVCLKK